jgi:hypothetical protein
MFRSHPSDPAAHASGSRTEPDLFCSRSAALVSGRDAAKSADRIPGQVSLCKNSSSLVLLADVLLAHLDL